MKIKLLSIYKGVLLRKLVK